MCSCISQRIETFEANRAEIWPDLPNLYLKSRSLERRDERDHIPLMRWVVLENGENYVQR